MLKIKRPIALLIFIILAVFSSCSQNTQSQEFNDQNEYSDLDSNIENESKEEPEEEELKEFDWNLIKDSSIELGNKPSNHANNGLVCEYNGWIYFNDFNNEGYLCRKPIDGTGKQILVQEICYNINLINENIFFKCNETGSIKRCDLDGSNLTTLVEQKVNDFIATSCGIFFCN